MPRNAAGKFVNGFNREILRIQEIQQINKNGAPAASQLQRAFCFSINSLDGRFIHIPLRFLQRLFAHSQLTFLKTQVDYAAFFEP